MLVAAGCSSPTTGGPRFDLNDAWVGTFRGATRVVEVRLALVTGNGSTIGGSATLDSMEYEVVGRYEPPTVWFELTSPAQEFDFVGEMVTSGLINGSGLLASEEAVEVGRLTLARR